MKRCYKVIVKLKAKSGTVPDTTMTFETLADTPLEAEQAVMARHHKDWEAHYLFDGVQAVYPCEEAG